MLESDFGPALVGALLSLDTLALTQPWEELEKARVLKANCFAHDLVYETVRQDSPPR